jgi:RNA polymerase sigma factor (sigma-70 family)
MVADFPKETPINTPIRVKQMRELIQRQSRLGLSITMNYTNDLTDAQNILSKAYVKASNKLRAATGDKNQQTWFLRFVIASCIAHTKRNKWFRKNHPPKKSLADEDFAVNTPEDEEGMASAFQRELFDALQKLKRWQRMFFILRFYEGMPVKTIVTITGKNQKFVCQSLLQSVERISLGKF